MEIVLTPPEARVLGCLLEKEMTTPEYYPLTLNSLIAACNQKSNRDPVVDFGETTIVEAIEGLRQKRLALRVDEAGAPSSAHCYCGVFKRSANFVSELNVWPPSRT